MRWSEGLSLVVDGGLLVVGAGESVERKTVLAAEDARFRGCIAGDQA